MPYIDKIVIHCAASANGRALGNEQHSAAQVIDGWHKARGFERRAYNISKFNGGLHHIGYHYVIDTDGNTEPGRHELEMGAHVKGHNAHSIGICMVGTDQFTASQWTALAALMRELKERYPQARICGHRDLSPDINGDGTIEPNEWLKTCPGFTVADWLAGDMAPLAGHICEARDD